MSAPREREHAEAPVADRTVAGTTAAAQWGQIHAAAPQIAGTMQRYLQRLAAFQAPRSVDVAENSVRQFARWMITDAGLDSVAAVRRDDIEDFKVWLANKPHPRGGTISPETHRQRLRMVRAFFERIIEWDWPDAPARNPVISGDIPKKPEPLPRFLDDQDAAKFMTAARAATDPRVRLVVELLARTGMRVGELVALEADSVVQIGGNHWLRIPLGKLRNDRYVPLHPQLVTLLGEWTAVNLEHIRAHQRLVADHRGPMNRHSISRIVHRVGDAAGVPGVHPHRLRHTLATQAINRGMRLEAIAALLGHKKMEMTLIYARIANRVVADEYAAVSAKIDALYGQQPPPALPADYETTGMARLRREAHARMLGNGLCTRRVELDCRMESACETCAYFRTSTQFLPILTRQRDHAADHGQTERAELFTKIIGQVDDSAT
ncbi:tyrosine-type recombinase/integrase [Jatrophihabitans lederbergiae]|uniref:Tyrosine-type recombinase/integrase n=1 Tax=Jatrophihabitans lederbergiae TaxID=3075547 RepID=A0ABU2JGR6_9ACTN|nr:tyrosine-type recombinase/integrase [Jatrophihabitans sp. DSM 44399]MDT0264190.1 tyrosine-type recombinase/integrase [Jatrophihabitans sp. DSM 44399]